MDHSQQYRHGVPYAQGMVPYDPARQQYDRLFNAAKFGAVVGATGAAAHNLHRLRRDGISPQQAALNTARAGLGAGAATAAAAAVGGLFGRSAWLSLAATLATGTAVMYVLEDLAAPTPEVQADD